MEMVVLIIHLLVCIALIGLVLLQRSEGGALGMGGGGGGSLMSGRGAADALAKMTSVAGGFFLFTSLGLTVLSGAASSGAGTSVLDLVPRIERSTPAPTPAEPTPAQPETTRPDPTESSAPQAAETQLAAVVEPAAPTNAARAAPLGPAQAAAATPTPVRSNPAPRTTAPTTPSGGAVVPASATTRAPARSGAATNPSNSTSNDRPLVLPNTSGSVTGIALTDDPAAQTESIEIGNGLEAVRREQRAGPEQ